MSDHPTPAAACPTPQWVTEALQKQLKAEFPRESDERITAMLERSAGLMEPTYSLATLMATATVLLREDMPRAGR